MYFIYNQIWNGNAIATLKKLIYFNWRIITLQYSDGFFHILTWISHIATLFTTFYAFRYPSVCQLLSRVQLFVTSWTAAHQAPLSIGFSRQEYWSGLPFPSPGDLPDPGIEPGSPALQADSLPTELWGKPPTECRRNYGCLCIPVKDDFMFSIFK